MKPQLKRRIEACPVLRPDGPRFASFPTVCQRIRLILALAWISENGPWRGI